MAFAEKLCHTIYIMEEMHSQTHATDTAALADKPFILHTCLLSEWAAAHITGEYRASSLLTEGFIHCSSLEQVAASANRHFRGQQNLVLLVISTEKLQSEIRWETAKHGGSYPHIYGALNTNAVELVLPYPPDSDGSFSTPTL